MQRIYALVIGLSTTSLILLIALIITARSNSQLQPNVPVQIPTPKPALPSGNATQNPPAQTTPKTSYVAPPKITTPVPVNPTSTVSSKPPTLEQNDGVTQREAMYMKHYMKIMGMVGNAEKRFKNSHGDHSEISLASSEISSAWQLQLRNFNVPDRFVTADTYLSNGLSEEMSAFNRVQMGISDGASDHYVAAGELFKKSIAAFQIQLKEIQG